MDRAGKDLRSSGSKMPDMGVGDKNFSFLYYTLYLLQAINLI